MTDVKVASVVIEIPGSTGGRGPQGTDGVQGIRGVQGVQGESAPVYNHDQTQPSPQWDIYHNLGFFPSVFVLDTSGQECVGDVTHISVNQVQLNFSASFAGTARLS